MGEEKQELFCGFLVWRATLILALCLIIKALSWFFSASPLCGRVYQEENK